MDPQTELSTVFQEAWLLVFSWMQYLYYITQLGLLKCATMTFEILSPQYVKKVHYAPLQKRMTMSQMWTFSFNVKYDHWVFEVWEYLMSFVVPVRFYMMICPEETRHRTVSHGEVYIAQLGLLGDRNVHIYLSDQFNLETSVCLGTKYEACLVYSRATPKRVYDISDVVKHLVLHHKGMMVFELVPFLFENKIVPQIPLTDLVVEVLDKNTFDTHFLHFFDTL